MGTVANMAESLAEAITVTKRCLRLRITYASDFENELHLDRWGCSKSLEDLKGVRFVYFLP